MNNTKCKNRIALCALSSADWDYANVSDEELSYLIKYFDDLKKSKSNPQPETQLRQRIPQQTTSETPT